MSRLEQVISKYIYALFLSNKLFEKTEYGVSYNDFEIIA